MAGEERERGGAEIQRDFHHPYTPYDIQEEFMSVVYRVLDESKIGILESPTGTVCLLSFQLCCSYVVDRWHVMWVFSKCSLTHSSLAP